MIELKDYQRRAVESLKGKVQNLLRSSENEIVVFQSPTGSGKTVMVSEITIINTGDVPDNDVVLLYYLTDSFDNKYDESRENILSQVINVEVNAVGNESADGQSGGGSSGSGGGGFDFDYCFDGQLWNGSHCVSELVEGSVFQNSPISLGVVDRVSVVWDEGVNFVSPFVNGKRSLAVVLIISFVVLVFFSMGMVVSLVKKRGRGK